MAGSTRDPRIQEHVHTHHLADDQFEAVVGLLMRIATPLPAEPVPADDEQHATTPFDLGMTPWCFHSPVHGADVVAYVDDRNQLRHVPTTRATEVPKTWQRVWLEPLQ